MGDFETILARAPEAKRAALRSWWDALPERHRAKGLSDLEARYPAVPTAQIATPAAEATATQTPGLPMMGSGSSVGADMGGPRVALPSAPGTIQSFVMGAGNAVVPFADEIAAAVTTGQVGGAEYETARRLAEYRVGQGAAEHPVATGLGTATGLVSGAALFPSASAEQLASRGALRVIGQGALEGGVIGGVYGMGASDPGQRLEGGALGTVGGAALGGLASTVGTIAGRTSGTRMGRAALDVAEAGDADLSASQGLLKGASPESPLVAADVLGPVAQSRVRTVAGVPGPGQAVLQDVLANRAAGRPQRIQGMLEDALGAAGVNPYSAAEQLQQARASQAETLFENALAPKGKEVVLPKTKTRALLRIPRVRDLVEEHRNLQRQSGTRIADDAPVTARELHYVKRVLRESGERVTPGERAAVQGQGARDRSVLGTVESTLSTVPGYATANREYRNASKLIEAYDFGTNLLTQDAAKVEHTLAGMTPDEIRMVQLGLPASTARAIESGSARAAMAKLGIGPSAKLGRKSVLARVLPPEVRQRFMQVVADEERMAATEAAGVLGSPTFPAQQGWREALRSGGSITGLARREIVRSLTGAPSATQLASEAQMLTTGREALPKLIGEGLEARAGRGQVRRGFNLFGRAVTAGSQVIPRTAEVERRAQQEALWQRLLNSGVSEADAARQVAEAFGE